jgi:hypothetical protein
MTEAFDPAQHLDTPEAVAEYLVAAVESGDAAIIADALGVARRAVAIDRELADLFARLDAGGPGDGRTLSEIEADIYGAFGEPV